MSRVLMLGTVFCVALSTAGMAGAGRSLVQVTRHVYVTVTSSDGQPVAGLTPADFRLRENNRDREITAIEPATEPMHIALMVEEALTPAGGVRQGMFEFLKVIQGKAQLSLVVVGQSNRTAVPFSADMNALVAGLNDLPLNQRQQTNHVPEGIGDMARTFQKSRPARPVMVMIALDSQQVSAEQPQEILNALRDSNAQLHVVSIQASRAAADVTGADGVMEASGRGQVLGDGPRQSGGRQWPVNALPGVSKATVSIANDLLNQYKVTYVLPAGTDPSDRLNLTTSRRGVTLRAPTRIRAAQ